MSVAYSIVTRLHHNLLLAMSPSYRKLRERLELFGQDPG
jgi:hypothetical protein